MSGATSRPPRQLGRARDSSGRQNRPAPHSQSIKRPAQPTPGRVLWHRGVTRARPGEQRGEPADKRAGSSRANTAQQHPGMRHPRLLRLGHEAGAGQGRGDAGLGRRDPGEMRDLGRRTQPGRGADLEPVLRQKGGDLLPLRTEPEVTSGAGMKPGKRCRFPEPLHALGVDVRSLLGALPGFLGVPASLLASPPRFLRPFPHAGRARTEFTRPAALNPLREPFPCDARPHGALSPRGPPHSRFYPAREEPFPAGTT